MNLDVRPVTILSTRILSTRWTTALTTRLLIRCVALSSISIAFAAAMCGQTAGQHGKAEKSNMELVGHDALQARSAYQPTIEKQGDRWIAYVGHHAGMVLNPLTGQMEGNGTSIVDVTDPKQPKYLAHIPGEVVTGGGGDAGGAQMVRVCAGTELPHADKSKFYMLRSFGNSAHEMWDVTDPTKPKRLNVVVSGLRDTHKSFWECDTGIAYLVGGAPQWRARRMTMIYDLSDPAKPAFIRFFGLPGQQPGSTGPMPSDVHGPISTGPKGNRVYFAYGPGGNGVLQIVDRDKLLHGPAEPTEANLLYPQIARVDLPPDAGAHTALPLLGMDLAEFSHQKRPATANSAAIDQARRDFVVVPGETTANECQDNRQIVRIFDITSEAVPVGISTWTVPEASGNFCGRGGRFGTHSTNENLTPIYQNRLIFVAHFNAGVRVLDIRDPFHPKEVAFYIPPVNGNTDKRCIGTGADQKCKVAIQTNNVEVDDRGYIYAVDRANTGLDILQLSGAARAIANFQK
jgi:hypothetical protein